MNLEAVYPNPNDSTEEFSFEELRARSRGWLDRDWAAEQHQAKHQAHPECESEAKSLSLDLHEPDVLITEGSQQDMISQSTAEQLVETAPVEDMTQGAKARKSKRPKVMEVKSESQISMQSQDMRLSSNG